MKYEKLIEVYVNALSCPDERQRQRLDEERGSRPQTRDARPWKTFTPKANTLHYEGVPAFLNLKGRDFNKLWIWSDQHLLHQNIIKYTKRPFFDANHMNRGLLDNFKKTVGKDDVSIWVGDVSFERGGSHITNTMLASLPGYKILVFGNHDLDKKGVLRSLYFDEIHAVYQFGNLIFSHYPLYTRLPEGYYSIHGHVHDVDTGHNRHVNVSVERVDFKPISLAALIDKHGINFKEEV